jgi:hypothetical protein
VKRQMHAHEAAKSLEAARQKAKLDAEVLQNRMVPRCQIWFSTYLADS